MALALFFFLGLITGLSIAVLIFLGPATLNFWSE